MVVDLQIKLSKIRAVEDSFEIGFALNDHFGSFELPFVVDQRRSLVTEIDLNHRRSSLAHVIRHFFQREFQFVQFMRIEIIFARQTFQFR